jgi:hypothetical protein
MFFNIEFIYSNYRTKEMTSQAFTEITDEITKKYGPNYITRDIMEFMSISTILSDHIKSFNEMVRMRPELNDFTVTIYDNSCLALRYVPRCPYILEKQQLVGLEIVQSDINIACTFKRLISMIEDTLLIHPESSEYALIVTAIGIEDFMLIDRIVVNNSETTIEILLKHNYILSQLEKLKNLQTAD